MKNLLKSLFDKAKDTLDHASEDIQEVVQAFNIPIYTAEGYEADDVLATLARQAAAIDVEAPMPAL